MERQQLARIRLLSRRFLELQGLRVALAGAPLALVMGGFLVATPAPTRNEALTALLGAVMLMIPAQWWAHRYYATKFGRQVRRPIEPRWIPVFVAGQLIVLSVFMYLNRRFPEIPAGAPTAVFFSLAALFIAVRDWPWRAHYLAFTAAVIVAFSASLAEAGDSGTTLARTLFAVGVALVPAGLLDHRLLVRLTTEARAHQAAVSVLRAPE